MSCFWRIVSSRSPRMSGGDPFHVGGRNFIELFEGEVEDIEQTAADLRTRGVEVTDVKLGGDRSLQAWLADPDGNRIELHQYTPESKQGPSLT